MPQYTAAWLDLKKTKQFPPRPPPPPPLFQLEPPAWLRLAHLARLAHDRALAGVSLLFFLPSLRAVVITCWKSAVRRRRQRRRRRGLVRNKGPGGGRGRPDDVADKRARTGRRLRSGLASRQPLPRSPAPRYCMAIIIVFHVVVNVIPRSTSYDDDFFRG